MAAPSDSRSLRPGRAWTASAIYETACPMTACGAQKPDLEREKQLRRVSA
jgi:hypothetical protein